MVEHLVFMRSEKYPYKGFLDTVLGLCKSNIIFTLPKFTSLKFIFI